MTIEALRLVGCGKRKAGSARRARDIYQGTLFRAARRYVEAKRDPWAIVSAKHGVIPPDRIVEPYELHMDDLTADAKRAWPDLFQATFVGWLTEVGLEAETVDGFARFVDPPPLEVLAGRPYVDGVTTALTRLGGLSWTIEAPLAGLGVGERMAWLKKESDAISRNRIPGRGSERTNHA